MIKKVLEYSIKNKLSHIPSALSMLKYSYEMFKIIDKDDWNIVVGKPFGAQALYIIWEELYGLNIDNLSYGVKDKEIDFVDYGEETLGNALGFSSGISYNGKRTYCNISDGALQMGPTLEAINFIGHHKQSIVLTIDYNKTQLLGHTTHIMGTTISNHYDIFLNAGWIPYIIESDKFNSKNIKNILDNIKEPIVFLIETTKGEGVVEMVNDPVTWHYRQLNGLSEVTLCEEE